MFGPAMSAFRPPTRRQNTGSGELADAVRTCTEAITNAVALLENVDSTAQAATVASASVNHSVDRQSRSEIAREFRDNFVTNPAAGRRRRTSQRGQHRSREREQRIVDSAKRRTVMHLSSGTSDGNFNLAFPESNSPQIGTLSRTWAPFKVGCVNTNPSPSP